MKMNKGITLVAVVITVIILLILAAVAISMIGGDNGLFGKAKNAAEKYNEATKQEADLINSLLSGNYTGSGEEGNISQDDLMQIIGELNSKVDSLTAKVEELENGGGNQLALYPVGSIYISTNETNPGELFGGTWETYGAGRTLVGVGTGEDTRGEQLAFAVNQTGGEYNHALSIAEMPSHNHTLTAVRGTSSSRALTECGSSHQMAANFLSSASSSSGTTSSTGSSSAHNNLQPYIACYMWQRVS